ncbi:ABC transporter permease, partial [Leptolyngbya cf. ectocarpi LEGE 11479]|nr:ABC transporter permease [Leptolyngbya cf. ectocarpi LEGE 11479]
MTQASEPFQDEFEPASLEPTVFWRIAEDIPKALSWVLLVVSVVMPLTVWWILSNYTDINPK